jgi:hypothetical protein
MKEMNGKNRRWHRGAQSVLQIPLLVTWVGLLGCEPEEYELFQDIVDSIGDTAVLGGDSEASSTGGAQSPTSESPPVDSGTGGVEASDGGENPDTAADAAPPEICMCECPCEGSEETAAPPPDSETSEVVPTEPGCLIISEVVEGSSMNKGVELYNCGVASLDLTAYSLCLYSNDAAECGTTFALSGSLDVGEVVTICHASAESLPNCDLFSGVTNFSGDDRLALSGPLGVVDAFGELLVRPEEPLWADHTLRRCNPAAHLGDTPFVTDEYFTVHDMDDFGDFGLPPTGWSCLP